ncbi:helix-turn-helix transcriptional regulator [Patulibacter minatonensis]|uniref:helix-turn-helix transcriptional regulator n=1 Tax=Patulibacter minatonensis TaxID=298163 RepID=UPI0004B04059|nr:LuxR C-terminal-related transcriptional regulator [Patulibacter minatonensis]
MTRSLERRAEELLGPDPAGPGATGTASARADRLVARIADALHERRDVTALARLALDAHDHALDAHAREAATARARVAACERGLSRMRTIATAAELLDAVCDEVADACGFARVLLSRVDDDTWSPWMVNAAVRDVAWWRAWDQRPIPVAEVPFEAGLVAEHRPGLVTDTSDARAHRFFHEGRSPSYVAAPIAASGTVVGFLHADHGTDVLCDATDRDLLWMFAEGFAHLFERAALTESMRHQREEVREILAVVDAAMASMTETELRLARPGATDDEPADAAPPAHDRADRLATLTPREHEVLAMIVSGARNADIGRELAISDATVKTHVRRVLAKLGVRNRTQAISWAMRG